MYTEPGARKHQDAILEIQRVLEDNTLPTEIQDALHVIWRHIDSQDKLKIGTKRNYIRYARGILRRILANPNEWTSETIITIMEKMKRKPDGTDYAPQYRNIVRITIKYILSAFDLKELGRICDDEETRVGKVMKLQRIPSAVDQFEVVEITEEHMRAVTSQMSSDRVRVFFWVLWDIGARPDDIRMMTLGDVEYDESGPGVVLWVPADTKTGRRPTRPRYSLSILRRYLGEHPYAVRNRDGSYKNPEVALFVNTQGNAWRCTRSISQHLRAAVKKVRKLEEGPDWPFPRLPQTVTCQALRINAVNRDMGEGASIEANALHHGHSVEVMMGVYRRRDRKALIKKEIDELAGIVRDESAQKDPWRTCPTCHHQNPPRNSYCANCGNPVTPEAIKRKEEESAAREKRIAEVALEMLMKEAKERGLLS